ncbi:MAG: ATP-binding protein [Thioalkalispiraceae bacterium]
MSHNMVDVTLHIDENITHHDREQLRDKLLQQDGVSAASYHDDKPHLMVIEYDPQVINSGEFSKIAEQSGLHAELVGL